MAIIQSTSGSHWYFCDGTPCHTVEAKSGKHKGSKRATTLRDARKEGLYPSVTNVLDCRSKTGLDRWKIENALKTAWDKPRPAAGTITMEEWIKEVYEKSRQIGRDAADVGTRLHLAAEAYATSSAVPQDSTILTLFRPFKAWFDNNVRKVRKTEFVVVGPGYAGTTDLWADIVGVGERIIDFKSRNWKEDKPKPNIYPEDGIQLSGYRRALSGEAFGMQPNINLGQMSLIISSANERAVYQHDWTGPEMENCDKLFQLAFETWKLNKGYDPLQFTPPDAK